MIKMVNLRKMYRSMENDIFPPNMSITIGEHTVQYRKVTWVVDGEEKGLRYGENPGQPASLYRPVNGNIILGGLEFIGPGRGLVCDMELLQSGKHPGKINLTDVDGALNILKYFPQKPTVAIMKHNNPCGVATGNDAFTAYYKANMADRVAAFGGAVALNCSVDVSTARAIAEGYSEVVVAPEYLDGALEELSRRKNLRILRIGNMSRLKEWSTAVFPDIKSLGDGGLVLQTSYLPRIRTLEALKKEGVMPKDVPERVKEGGKYRTTGNTVSIIRPPSESEYEDMLFGWIVESGITSNSVIYVKNGATVGIGTGEQDRVGVAKIARTKAYDKLRDRIAFEEYGVPYNIIVHKKRTSIHGLVKEELSRQLKYIEDEVMNRNGGLIGAVMVSDAFFPFRDGIDVGLKDGCSAVIQPGGSICDHESIIACNESGATMIFTGQRSFKH